MTDDDEMAKALQADGEKLRQLTGEDHGPWPLDEQTVNYTRYRGKCREMSEALAASDPSLTLVRGHYYCPIWGKQAHWWCKTTGGTIIDLTADQFPSRGAGSYVEFDGKVECSQCGKVMDEADASFESNYCFCSYECHGRFVGVL